MLDRSERSAGQRWRRQRQSTNTSGVTAGLLLKCLVIALAILFASLLSRSLSLGNDDDIRSGRLDLQDGGHGDGGRGSNSRLSARKRFSNHNRRQEQKQKQRLVMLVGPHKSASTSVQAYLIKLAKGNVLERFNWSWMGRDNLKGFSDASRYVLVPNIAGGAEKKAAKVRLEARAQWDAGNSLVAAAEFLDYVAAQPEREARASIKRLWDWLPTDATSSNNVEAVVMYRTPRSAHLLSAWKQQVQFRKAISVEPWRESVDEQHRRRKEIRIKPPSLAEWLCKGEYKEVMRYNISTILAAQLNPFGVAFAYHEYGGADVTMIDMAGVKDGDVPSSVVCDILKLPCTAEGKLLDSGLVSQARNKKVEPTELGMSDKDLNEAEEIIRDMDCYYYCQLGDKLSVLHGKDKVFADGKTSWKKCCERNIENGGRVDSGVASQRLRDLGCRSYEKIK